MKCHFFPGGVVCTRGQRRKCQVANCSAPAAKQCDYPVTRNGKRGTCDMHICAAHSRVVGPNRDYCPPHSSPQAPAPGEQLDLIGGTT